MTLYRTVRGNFDAKIFSFCWNKGRIVSIIFICYPDHNSIYDVGGANGYDKSEPFAKNFGNGSISDVCCALHDCHHIS